MRTIAVVLSVLAVGCGLSGCSSKAKKDRAAFAAAQQHFGEAKKALKEGRLRDASTAYDESIDAMIKLRRSEGRAFDEGEPPEGPVLLGRPAKVWQLEWESEFKQAVESEFDALKARTDRGELDWTAGQSFLMTHRRDLVERWGEGVNSAAAGQVKRLGEVYLFLCESPVEEDACRRVRAVLADKLARPLSDERLLTAESRASAFGFVTVHVSFSNEHRYDQLNSPQGTGVYVLNAAVETTIEVETHRGHSQWDGVKTFQASHAPPERVISTEMTEVREAQYQALVDGILTQVKALEKQVITP